MVERGTNGLIRSFFAPFQKIGDLQHDTHETGGFAGFAAPPSRCGWAPGDPQMRLSASQLACIRGGRHVFSGLGFAVDAGEAILVTGPNGSGKSSLLRLLAGLVAVAD